MKLQILNDDFCGVESITEKIIYYISIDDGKASIQELIYANDFKFNPTEFALFNKKYNLIGNGYLSICINTKNICN